MQTAIKLFICLFFISSPAFASQSIMDFLNKLMPSSGNEEVENIYVPPTLSNILKLYANTGLLDTANPKHLDQYLAVTECGLYKEFRDNEFELSKIRLATQDTLNKKKDSFSKRFEYTQPIFLSEYDFAKGGFLLKEQSIIPPVSKLQIGNNGLNFEDCVNPNNYDSDELPTNIILSIDRPFSLSLIRTDQVTAEGYVKYLDAEKIDLMMGRPAYIRYRVRLDNFVDREGKSTETVANFQGAIESITIFGDKDKAIKLYEENY